MKSKETKIVKIDPDNIDLDIMQEAANIIIHGGLVVFPTETVYGLGADTYNEEACRKIFEAKGRPQDNPLIVHIYDKEQLNDIVKNVPENAWKLAESYWPGPLTMIMNKSDKISHTVTAKLDTVAVRLPNNKIARELIRLSGRPISAPSANTSGKPSPTIAQHVIDDLYGKVDMIIDGGSTRIGLESTVLDMTVEKPTILRPGGITKENIEYTLGCCDYDPAIIKSNENIIPKSPGQKYRHYSPKAKVITYKGYYKKAVKNICNDCLKFLQQGMKVGIIATEQTKECYKDGIVQCIGDRKNPLTIASNLFKELREFDKIGVDIILSEAFEENNIGKAIMNRLEKASSEVKNVGCLNILFVCTGNTCRSCMAEAITNYIARKDCLFINASSAGINVYEGYASKNAVTVLNEIGMDISNHTSRQITEDMLTTADVILTMTENQKDLLLRTNKEISHKIYTLKEYVGDNEYGDITDPYGSDVEGYIYSRDEIKNYINKLIKKIYL